MRNLIQYSSKVSRLFHGFLYGVMSKDELIDKLKNVEQFHRDAIQDDNKANGFVFKFSEDDSLATTIDDLNRDLSDLKNREFTIERMKSSITLEGDLIINYC